MSIKVTEIGTGYAVVVMGIEKKHMNPFGGLHGGAYASAIDTAAYWSADCDLPEEDGLVSIDLKVDFLAPVLHEKDLPAPIDDGAAAHLLGLELPDVTRVSTNGTNINIRELTGRWVIYVYPRRIRNGSEGISRAA